jgi:hypothetical protein
MNKPRTYTEEEREYRRKKSKEYYWAHKEERRVYNHEYGIKNRESLSANSREYYQNNKEKWNMTREKKDRANKLERKHRAESEEERIKHRKEATEWRKNNPLKSKAIKIRKYGITLEQFNELLEAQSGECAICGMSDRSNPVKFPLVDHCHTGNHVRGLLCSNCNHGLGHFKDSPALLRKAAKYVEKNGLFGPIMK